jgi:hypothetical protein
MYPASGPVRERWFRPRGFRRELGRWFRDVRVEFLLSPGEVSSVVFRRIAPARLMTLWTGTAPGGRDV